MSRKGMSTTMEIIVAIVVILVAALIIISFFAGGIQNVGNVISEWINSVSGGGGPGTVRTCESAGGACVDRGSCTGSVNLFATCPVNKECCVNEIVGPPAPGQ